MLLHIRELNESQATHNYRLTKLEKAPNKRKTDTDKLKRRLLLPQGIADVFDLGELRLLAYRLSIDFDNLAGDGLVDKALSLALLMQRNGRFLELLRVLGEERPLVDWSAFR